MICSDKAWALIQKSMKACYKLADGTGSLEDLDKELVELAEYIKDLEEQKESQEFIDKHNGRD